MGVSLGTVGEHHWWAMPSIREGKLGAKRDTKASRDSDSRLRGSLTVGERRASGGNQLQPRAQTDRQVLKF